MLLRKVTSNEKSVVADVANIHLLTFRGFFLTFLGRGFLIQLYRSFCEHKSSDLLVAFNEDGHPVGFLAYSANISDLYKYMLKKRFLQFGWYSFCACIRRPTAFCRLLRALFKSGEVKRTEKYVELASIGVSPKAKNRGIGSMLIDALKSETDFSEYAYISLDTDAKNNDAANAFYRKNGFVLERVFVTREGREMNEYRYRGEI